MQSSLLQQALKNHKNANALVKPAQRILSTRQRDQSAF